MGRVHNPAADYKEVDDQFWPSVMVCLCAARL